MVHSEHFLWNKFFDPTFPLRFCFITHSLFSKFNHEKIIFFPRKKNFVKNLWVGASYYWSQKFNFVIEILDLVIALNGFFFVMICEAMGGDFTKMFFEMLGPWGIPNQESFGRGVSPGSIRPPAHCEKHLFLGSKTGKPDNRFPVWVNQF